MAPQPAGAPGALVYLKLVLVTLLWGGTFIAGRLVSAEVPPMLAATLRFLVAGSLLVMMAWRMEGGLPRLNARQMAATLGLGASGIFMYNLCFFSALQYMPAGRTALIVALNPTVTTLILALFFRERTSPAKWGAIALAFAGAAVIITRGDLAGTWHDVSRSVGIGELFMFCAIVAWAVYTILGRHALKGLSPLAATTYAVLWGVVLLGVGALTELDQIGSFSFSGPVWVSVVYLGALGSAVGFVWYYEGVKAIGPSRAAVFNNLVPVFGVVLAYLVLDEPVLVSMVVGAAMVITGVTLANRVR
jgi:drug/metabolite transporter (DMT)-like permease